MLNAIGSPIPARALSRRHTAEAPRLALPLWCRGAVSAAADYAETCGGAPRCRTIELNLSCPNVDEAADPREIVRPAATRRASSAVRSSPRRIPTWRRSHAQLRDAGADGLSLINTMRGLAHRSAHAQLRFARGVGGLSGPSLKPIALRNRPRVHAATRLPIRRMGGITTARDVVEFIACGAQQVALGTVLFSDPDGRNIFRERSTLSR